MCQQQFLIAIDYKYSNRQDRVFIYWKHLVIIKFIIQLKSNMLKIKTVQYNFRKILSSLVSKIEDFER